MQLSCFTSSTSASVYHSEWLAIHHILDSIVILEAAKLLAVRVESKIEKRIARNLTRSEFTQR
jgi:hypothetical protein